MLKFWKFLCSKFALAIYIIDVFNSNLRIQCNTVRLEIVLKNKCSFHVKLINVVSEPQAYLAVTLILGLSLLNSCKSTMNCKLPSDLFMPYFTGLNTCVYVAAKFVLFDLTLTPTSKETKSTTLNGI